MAIAAARGNAGGKEDDGGVRQGIVQFGREAQSTVMHVLGDEAVEAALIDRDLALSRRGDLRPFGAHDTDLAAKLGKAGVRHRPT